MNNIVQSTLYTLLFAAFENFTCNKLVKNFKHHPNKKNRTSINSILQQ